MNQPLPLYPGAKPCVQSGFCCKQGPCPFGDWDAAKHQCKYLTYDNKCSIYDWIFTQPGWEQAPAFGAGCCSPLNSDRLAIIRARSGGAGSAGAGVNDSHHVD